MGDTKRTRERNGATKRRARISRDIERELADEPEPVPESDAAATADLLLDD